MRLPSREMIQDLKKQYPVGIRVKLVYMDDVHAPPAGTLGTVRWVDDIGTIHVDWDNGSRLGAAYGVDTVRKVTT